MFMNFKVDDRTYEIMVASDVQRDGLAIELWDRDKNKLIIEIFRNDEKKSISFFCDKCDIPLSVLETLLTDFDQRVGRTFQEDVGENLD